jgi:hypothetical protein
MANYKGSRAKKQPVTEADGGLQEWEIVFFLRPMAGNHGDGAENWPDRLVVDCHASEGTMSDGPSESEPAR